MPCLVQFLAKPEDKPCVLNKNNEVSKRKEITIKQRSKLKTDNIYSY